MIQFEHLRIQIVHPCQAKCAWCSTHRKNPEFSALHRDGSAEEFHDFYLEVVRKYRPKEVYISGGEPFLYPGIEGFVQEVARHVEAIHIFTSYQFSRKVMARVAEMDLPFDQMVLNHTPIYFEPEQWHRLTNGFPFDIYLDNVCQAVGIPFRKRFKFIINHDGFADEIARFQELVKPDGTCEISLKVMNDQGDGIGVETMRRTADLVQERLGNLDNVLAEAGWGHRIRPRTSADLMRPVIETGDVEKCVYRRKPLELRLAYHQGTDGRRVVKYRYCPYFPPDFGHRFHIGRDDIEKLGKNYRKGPFRDHCTRCRLLHYRPPCEAAEGREV